MNNNMNNNIHNPAQINIFHLIFGGSSITTQ